MAANNPFKMPTDQEVFRLRDEEKRQKALEREKLRYQRVHEKTTWSARIGTANMRNVMGDESPQEASKIDPSQLEVHLPTLDIRENASMALYIEKKREMGLIRMSLATKRQEIKKLDEEAERAENRIRQQEEQLQETGGKFDAFLNHSAMEQVEAVNRADAESKAKLEKMAEIKKLSTQIAAVETDKKKNEELLATCKEFKEFLDGLTPASFFRDTLYDYLCQRERARLTAQFEAAFELSEGATEAEERQLENERQSMLQQLEEHYKDACAKIAARLETMSAEEVKAEVDSLDPEPDAMYFTKPEQILAKFVEIEEGNLFLITTCQEFEGEIEAVAQTYQKEQQEMIRNAEARRSQMEEVSQKIQVWNAKMRQLQDRIDRAKDNTTTASATAVKPGEQPKQPEVKKKTQEEIKQEIEEKVKAIFRTLPGHGEDSNTLTMLTHIEMKLEEMRAYVKSEKSGIDPAFVNQVMKSRDKERRQELRKQNQNELREIREKRSLLALTRSQAPVKKRVGKPVMWRSRPLDQKKQEITDKEVTQADADEEFFQ
jgi:hypothetical protein